MHFHKVIIFSFVDRTICVTSRKSCRRGKRRINYYDISVTKYTYRDICRRYLSFVKTQARVTSRVKGRFETRASTHVYTICTAIIVRNIYNEIKLTGTMRKIILSPIYVYIYMQVLRICLSNRGTPRRAEKLCHFHIFRPPLTSPRLPGNSLTF